MLRSLLIANRGEIACRIIKTCRRLDIRTIAVFSDADRGARHVVMADEAIHIGPSPAIDSYLRVDKIHAAAKATGAEAIHPGYGFLAESAAFARAVGEAGLIFVGPSPAAMEALGAKDAAKRVAERAGVPLVPGYHGADQADDLLMAEAARIGFPLLIKAVAGGGGKGMRRVDKAADFPDSLGACRREAGAAFGDDRVLLERLIVRPRHVEVQVFGDRHGNVVHLFERDCTLQRRHQKIIEEAPAVGLAPETRGGLHRAAVALARTVGYTNAGTVEFLVEPGGGFHFIEMNTRLQVEHPVTEAITGLDLVEWQLRVASGEPLPLRQEQITCAGHAFEARIYAEDPAKGFLPSIGRIEHLGLLESIDGSPTVPIRIETGVRDGDLVTPFYDPMIAKVIVQGEDRAAALVNLQRVLRESFVAGLETNIDFLERVALAPPFADLAIDTSWLDRDGAVLAVAPALVLDELLAAAAMVVLYDSRPRTEVPRPHLPDANSPWKQRNGWRLNAPSRRREVLHNDTSRHVMVVEGTGPDLIVELDGERHAIRASYDDGLERIEVERNGQSMTFVGDYAGNGLSIGRGDRQFHMSLEYGDETELAEEAGAGLLAAPMPGKVTKVLVAVGQTVEAGQGLAILEAMKMEHRFEAPAAGVVTAVHVREGEQVEEGTILLDIEPIAEIAPVD